MDLLLVPKALVAQAMGAAVDVGAPEVAIDQTIESPTPGHGPPVPMLVTGVIADTALVAAFDRLRRSLDTPAPEPLEQQCRLQAYLQALVERASTTRSPDPDDSRCRRALDRVRDVIVERYAERITLDDLAVETGFSKFYLERSFNERFGVPIHQFLKRVRIGMALARMREGARPSTVAKPVGFADQPHMTRVFRDELGFTPRSYWAASRPADVRRPRTPAPVRAP